MQFSTPDLADRIAAFSRNIIEPNILHWERQHETSRQIFKEAAKYGLLSLETPVSEQGMSAPFSDKMLMAREMSKISMAAVFSLINSQNVAARLATSETTRHRIDIAPLIRSGDLVGCTALTEPGAGSDFAAITTRAEKISDGWKINGHKAWITNAADADIIMLYAQTDPAKGWKGIASFLIDARREGFERGKIYDLIGGHAIGAGEFTLKDYVARDDDMLAPPGEAFKIAMMGINGARTYVAAMCAGMISDALDKAISYGKSRQSFGKPIIAHQGLKWSLTDVALQLECLDLLTQKAARIIDAGEDAVLSAALAKKLAGEVTVPALTACIQAMGANGLLKENRLGLHLACAKIAAYTDGSTEMMNERIGASL